MPLVGCYKWLLDLNVGITVCFIIHVGDGNRHSLYFEQRQRMIVPISDINWKGHHQFVRDCIYLKGDHLEVVVFSDVGHG